MELLESLVVIFAASALVVFLLHRLRVPSLVGFLLAGVIIGPHGVGIIKDTHSVETLAEIGVILLLFAVGIEFSMSRLLRIKKTVFGSGGMQVFLTIMAAASGAFFMTGKPNVSLFFGFLVALSSTAIVLKILSEKGEIDSPHGRAMVGILIFQDLCVVPLMLLIPLLAGGATDAMDVFLKIGKALIIVVAVILSSRKIVPLLLHQVVHTRSRELFIITIILLCLGIALITSRFGLSLALGAFLAGLVISESEYAHQAISDILPFKDSFIGLFFVSIGMLIDTGYMFENCLYIGAAVVLILGLKIATGTVSAIAFGFPVRASIHAGLGLAQVGEFSFVLANAGKLAGIITADVYQIFMASSVVTMMLTPFALNFAPSLSARIASMRQVKKLSRMRRASEGESFPRKKQGHVIIIGFGLNGRNLARVLKEAGLPYSVLEINNDTVREMKKKGEPIYYGDGTSKEILHKLGIGTARLLVIAISDPVSARRIVSIARHENPSTYIIVRTRYLAEVDDLKELGADEVIPEEFETSIEIFSRVLHKYNFPHNVILDMVDSVRQDSYTALRSVELPKRHLFEKCEWLPDIEINGFSVPVGSRLAGKSITRLQVRKKTGVTVIAVRRGPEIFTNPEPDFLFKEGDVILFTGERKGMDAALEFFKGKEETS